jgi:hypothetical protein
MRLGSTQSRRSPRPLESVAPPSTGTAPATVADQLVGAEGRLLARKPYAPDPLHAIDAPVVHDTAHTSLGHRTAQAQGAGRGLPLGAEQGCA